MSAEIQVDLLDGNMLEGHVDRIADEPGGIRDLAVDIACGDDERLGQVVERLALCAVELLRDLMGERAAVRDRGYADGQHRNAERLPVERGARVVHARAGDDAGVGKLHGG